MFIFSRAVIGVGVEDEDKKHTWMEDAESVSVLIIYSVKSTVTCMTKRALILKKLPILGISYSMFEILCGSHVFCFVFPSLNRV